MASTGGKGGGAEAGTAPAKAVAKDGGEAAPPPPDLRFLNHYRNAGYFSRMACHWAGPLVRTAFNREVQPEELWALNDHDVSAPLSDKLLEAWNQERARHGAKAKLWRAVRKVFLGRLSWAAVYMSGWLIAVLITNAFLLVELLNLLQQTELDGVKTVSLNDLVIPVRGFALVAGFFVGELFRSLCVNHHWEIAATTGVALRGAAAGLLFGKLTRLRRASDAVGQLLNIVANDIERLRDAANYGLFVITTPVTLLCIIILGFYILGPAILAGFVVLVLSVPVQAWIAKTTSRLRREGVAITDRRVTLMNEILKAAQLIKLYAWEDSFMAKIDQVRSEELVKIRETAYTKALNGAFGQTVPVITSLVTFVVHTMVLGKDLTASQAFATVSMFNISRFPLNVLPLAVRFLAEFMVAMKRIAKFLMLEEVDPALAIERLPVTTTSDVALQMHAAYFTWAPLEDDDAADGKPSDKDEANQGNLEQGDCHVATNGDVHVSDLVVPKGSLVAVVGKVGAGKSSFFGTILGDLRKVSGTAQVFGSLAYVGQNPWVFNATVLDNILLGKPYDEERFKMTVHACALAQDIDMLPQGETTEIGERGINLSGGQKVRLALARAVYADADVYLLDDILSAVDVHVSAHIWSECVLKAIRAKTVIIATHALQNLPSCDRILVFQNMHLATQGTYEELEAQPDFVDLVKSAPHHPGTGAESQAASATSTEAQLATSAEAAVAQGEALDAEAVRLESEMSAASQRPASELARAEHHDHAVNPAEPEIQENDGKLIKAEDRNVGSVSFNTVRAFAASAGGMSLLVGAFSLFVVSEGTKQGSDAWLTAWTEDSFEKPESFYNTWYGVITVVVAILMIVRGVLFAWTALRASRRLHNSAFLAVMEARMDFFQTTPLGRILARFSSDIDKIDVLLVDIAEMAIVLLVRCFLSLVVIVAVLPWFLVPVVPMVWVYSRMLDYTRRVTRQMKRMDSMSRSPLMSHFQSISQGLTSARAYSIMHESVDLAHRYIDDSSRAYLGFFMSNRWIAIRVDFITTAIVSVSALFCVIFASRINPGLAGLVLTSALQTSGIFQFATRQLAELEAQLTSVERLRYFIENTPREQQISASQAAPHPPEDWPKRGEIEFQGYSTAYRKNLPLVLRQLKFTIAPGTKTAFVGRTGSGKSTTLLALFRVLEAVEGRILVDGVDIAAIPLKTLRSRVLSIVPQDATLFAGTIRYNLDPFNNHSDDAIWSALARVHLADFVRAQGVDSSAAEGPTSFAALGDGASTGNGGHVSQGGSGLDYVLEEAGLNLSAGQRQLFCFARALLRNTRIICLDEALSSVDEKSDSSIRETLEDACQGRTLLVIAHRLSTVRAFDSICVLDSGKLVEQGPPSELAAKEGGIFAAMWAAHTATKGNAGIAQ